MSETTDILSEGLPADIEKEFNDGMDAYRAKRGANARNIFPNAPESISCRVCETNFPNPILEGSSICMVVCKTCRTGMLSEKTQRRMVRDGEVSKRTIERANNNQPDVARIAVEAVSEIDPAVFKSLRSFKDVAACAGENRHIAGVGHFLSKGGYCCDECNQTKVLPARFKGVHL